MIRPNGEILTAGYFIPAAEHMGIVHLVDRFALETVIAQLKAHKTITLAVNVSGTAADDPAWLQGFVDYIRDNGEVAGRLIVELTETAALHHFEENARFITQLKELGVRVAIDDFGAGYTSFRNLQMLMSTVKIDGSYVKDLAAIRKIRCLSVPWWAWPRIGPQDGGGMGRLRRRCRLLQSFGVDYFQGFHFGEPVLDPAWSKSYSRTPGFRGATTG